MVKRICSVVLMFVMLISIQVLAFAEYFYVGGFNENNLPAKKIAISDNYAFVACGEGVEATDKINVYNLGTKELITTLSLPIYTTGKDYFVENMYVVGEDLYISWNKNGGSGDPSVRQYEISKMLSGTLEHTKRIDVQGNCVTYLYDNKLFFTSPVQKFLSILDTKSGSRKDVMNIHSAEEASAIKGILADSENFYIYKNNEIRAYSTEKVYSGEFQNYDETKAVYKSNEEITSVILIEGKLYITSKQGIDVISLADSVFENIGSYYESGDVTAATQVGKNLYVYAENEKCIQILDITNPQSITVKDKFTVKNQETEGISDIAAIGNKVYLADLTEGFSFYSQNELDKLEQKQEAGSYQQELEMSTQRKAVELVVGLGIMGLRSNGLFGSELYITRGEFANSASKLLGDIPNGTYAINEFTDVAKDSEYAEGIYGLANLGILNGFGDGTFRPDEPVSYEHAVKIMIKILGYYPLVENSNRTCIDLASELKILNGVKQMESGYISRENVARLIYNSLETATLKFVSGINPYAYEEVKEETLLYKMGIAKVKGQITATEFTSLSGVSSASKGKVIIGNTEYFEGSSGASTLLGRYVTAYYLFDDSKNDEILYVLKDENDDVITVSAKDISSETTDEVFVYFDENEKVQYENIVKASVIYNGKFYADYTAEDLKPDDGEVTLIDSDGDGVIDAVIVENYKTYVTRAFGAGKILLKYGYSDIDLNDLSNKSKLYVDVDGIKYSNVSDIKGITEGNILSVKSSHDGEVVEIYVSKNSVVGVVTKLEADKKVMIDETEYEISLSYTANVNNPSNQLKKISAGDEVFAYFNKFGKIAHFEHIETSLVYGYLVGCERGEGLETEKVQFKILAKDDTNVYGSMQYFDGSDNLKVNGNKVTDIHTVAELFDPETGLKEQIVKFSLSIDGKLKELYTAKDKITVPTAEKPNPYYEEGYIGYDENEFTYDMKVSGSAAYRGGSRQTFDGKAFYPDVNTIIFVVPIRDNPKDEEYKIYTRTAIFKPETQLKQTLYCYDNASDYSIGACVMKANVADIDTVSTSTSFVLIDSFGIALSEDGEEKTVLYGPKAQDGTKEALMIEDDELTDTTGGILKNLYKGKKLVDLPKGSVIQYVKNANDEIAAIRIMYIPGSTDSYFETGRYEVTKDYMSAIYQCYAKVVTYLPEANRLVWNGHEKGEDRTWDRSSGMGGSVYLYDSKTNRITTIDKTQILPGDDVFLSQSNYSTKMTVVYR